MGHSTENIHTPRGIEISKLEQMRIEGNADGSITVYFTTEKHQYIRTYHHMQLHIRERYAGKIIKELNGRISVGDYMGEHGAGETYEGKELRLDIK